MTQAHVTRRTYSKGTLWSVMGQRMIYRDCTDKELIFDTREGRLWLGRDEMETMIQSGDATVVERRQS